MRFLRCRPPLAESSRARAAGVFSTDGVADLPAPARRYLRHAIAPDHYSENEGRVGVTVLGVIPVARQTGADVTRSSRGRLVAEAVWCPTALVGPDVRWEGVDDDRARFTLTVDGDAIPVTIRVGSGGALRDVTLERWGTVDVPKPQPIPYGFKVLEEGTFGGITIPVRLRGGWWYGTDRFDSDEAAEFVIREATF